MDDIACIADMRSAARQRLPRAVFDFIDGGAEDERTLADNREGFARIRFAPRVLRDVSNRSLATRILGEPSAAPLFIAPTGLAALACPAADVHLAQVAAGAGIPFTLSTSASATIEEVATATSTAGVAHSRNWFQLYVFRNREVTHDLMDRALASGYRTLVVTLDVPVLGKRERDLRNRFTVPLRPTLAGLWDLMLHPRWCAQVLRAGTPRLKNYTGYASGDSTASLAAWINSELDPTLCWDDIRALRARWPGPMLLKGIVRADDVLAARQAGVDGVVISNHGGRQLDGAPATIDALRGLPAEARAGLEIFLDGGVRRGSDVVKALCLGATAVGIGRPVLYGAAAGGRSGIDRVLAIFLEEIDRTLALLGVRDIASLRGDALLDAGTARGWP